VEDADAAHATQVTQGGLSLTSMLVCVRSRSLNAPKNPAKAYGLYPAKAPCCRFGSDDSRSSISIREERARRIASSRAARSRRSKARNVTGMPIYTWCAAFVMKEGQMSAEHKVGAISSFESSACRRHSPRNSDQTLAAVTAELGEANGRRPDISTSGRSAPPSE